jgi:methionyl aminopeptidase
VIVLRTAAEIDAIAHAGRVLADLHTEIGRRIEPGVSTAGLDAFAEDFIRSHAGAEPAFKGLYGFPATLCTSINEEVVHGIPTTRRVLKSGDIITIDAGVKLDGWFADAARTFAAGAIDGSAVQLLATTQEALSAGIAQATAGNRLGDVGHAIQRVAEQAGFGVVRDLVGHGIGREPHEEPQVPNYGKPGRGVQLRAGMVLAIEPMINEGGVGVKTLPDRWTVVTADGSRSAHFEETVAITAEGPRILTR